MILRNLKNLRDDVMNYRDYKRIKDWNCQSVGMFGDKIYAYEVLTGFANAPEYYQITKEEFEKRGIAMVIHTERLVLKPLGMEYLQTVNKYATDLENTKYMMHLPNENIDETRSFLEGVTAEWQKETPTFYEFAIILDGKHIGAVSVYLNEDCSEGELGWILDKDYWGCGYTSEAGRALVDMCVEKLGVRKFIAHCDSENEASKGVMRKLGMHLEAEYDGRKNRASDEMCRECEYRMEVN